MFSQLPYEIVNKITEYMAYRESRYLRGIHEYIDIRLDIKKKRFDITNKLMYINRMLRLENIIPYDKEIFEILKSRYIGNIEIRKKRLISIFFKYHIQVNKSPYIFYDTKGSNIICDMYIGKRHIKALIYCGIDLKISREYLIRKYFTEDRFPIDYVTPTTPTKYNIISKPYKSRY